jgi:hypothetical protein
MKDQDKILRLLRSDQFSIIQAVEDYLEGEGIRYMTRDIGISNAYGFGGLTGIGLSGVKEIFVFQGDYAKAHSFLEDFFGPDQGSLSPFESREKGKLSEESD